MSDTQIAIDLDRMPQHSFRMMWVWPPLWNTRTLTNTYTKQPQNSIKMVAHPESHSRTRMMDEEGERAVRILGARKRLTRNRVIVDDQNARFVPTALCPSLLRLSLKAHNPTVRDDSPLCAMLHVHHEMMSSQTGCVFGPQPFAVVWS